MRHNYPSDLLGLLDARARSRDEATGMALRNPQRHHRKLRKHGGEHTAVNVVVLSSVTHHTIHASPAKARATGWIVPSHEDPALVPVFTHSGWRLVTAAGLIPADPLDWQEEVAAWLS